MDVVQRFISQCCVIDLSKSIATGCLYDVYLKWSKDNGEFAISKQMFGRRLTAKGYESFHKKEGNFWRGLTVNEYGVQLINQIPMAA